MAIRKFSKKVSYRVVLIKEDIDYFKAFIPEFTDLKVAGTSLDDIIEKTKLALLNVIKEFDLNNIELPKKKSILEVQGYLKENTFLTVVEVTYTRNI